MRIARITQKGWTWVVTLDYVIRLAKKKAVHNEQSLNFDLLHFTEKGTLLLLISYIYRLRKFCVGGLYKNVVMMYQLSVWYRIMQILCISKLCVSIVT